MARGGPRTGTPGKGYGNRTDMNAHQPIRTATGQPYGQASQQAAEQRAMPLPNNVTPMPGAQQAAPPQITPLDAPTDRPDEPVTHGLDIGPGAGSGVLGLSAGPMDVNNPYAAQLRALYVQNPNNDLLRLLEAMDS